MDDTPITVNPWAGLRRFTDARIALGRSGVSLPTAPQLAFQLAHAQARDAVHRGLDVARLADGLAAAWPDAPPPCLLLHSAAADRSQYLQRPDLGRRLDVASLEVLSQLYRPAFADDVVQDRPYDLALVVADGLSALAIEQNAAPFLYALHQRMAGEGWRVAPLCIAQQARVAIGDDIGQALGAKAVVVLIGERPGLSSPDSMGLYLTWMPRVGLSDASRNCISNVRPAGLAYADAAFKLHYLLTQARQRQLSGVDLKDETAPAATVLHAERGNFLLK
ncbi:ethanolamine ammonia-lyase subunit EutC [Rhodoferax sp.]|uniref:ethanolamine ammonia-lyase subunit EutC n=1 Tax=Rhodoferax sp. TaxID=50421 RepID=UPI002ACEF8B1|nr:ethanolamine ammonia-lyase subunit EutC [Rhodoferax sp.]MDZ7922067.1 ethanolamine ammonia-lyase subunit EutC [Rhodoferax sp.]